jgi:hydrogenase maturation protease
MGGTPGRVWIVGCEPLSTDEEMGLSPEVEQAVDEAVALLLDLIEREGRQTREIAGNPASALEGTLQEKGG